MAATPDTTTQWHLRAPVPGNPIVFFGERLVKHMGVGVEREGTTPF